MSKPVGGVIPILRSFDETETKRFYVDYLGFTVDWEHRFEPGLPLYMQVSLGDSVLHLSEHFGDCSPGGAVRIWVKDADGLLAELNSRPHPRLKPDVQDQSWGLREVMLRDPNFNRVIFAELPKTS